MAKKNWIASALPKSHHGIFSAKAKRAGMSTHACAEKEKNVSGKLGAEARLALAFEGMHGGIAAFATPALAKGPSYQGAYHPRAETHVCI